MARANRELQAIATESQHATHAILQAVEAIDEAASTLAALAGDQEQKLARDIRDCVVQILEACNFQDVTGQRIAHVTATLARVERRLDQPLTETMKAGGDTPGQSGNDNARRFLHGPKLAGDDGHLTQAEIDRIFCCG